MSLAIPTGRIQTKFLDTCWVAVFKVVHNHLDHNYLKVNVYWR